MPTIISHAAVPLALGLSLGKSRISRRLLLAGMLASMLPDCDVVAFKLGIAYAHAFGHRGASHSLLFALAVGMLAWAAAAPLQTTRVRAFMFIALATISHPLLDCLTNGGLGIALAWPWSQHRFFAPWRVIEVSPIGAHGLFTARGWAVIQSELYWVWLPAVSLGMVIYVLRCWRDQASPSTGASA